MDGQIERAIPDPAQPPKPAPELPETDETARSFFSEEERVLEDIAGGSGFTFKRGDGWAIDPETGEGTYDTKFFTEQGYTPSQALLASFHEIDHMTELAQLLETGKGRETWEVLKERKQRQERTHLLWNCVTRDPADNSRVLQLAPAFSEDMTSLYREKLFPETDFRDAPLHLQILNAILRTSMLPDEPVTVDPKVTQAIEEISHIKTKRGEEKDVIALVTDPIYSVSF